MRTSSRLWVLLACVVLPLAACDGRADNEVRLLLDRADRIQHDAPIPLRRQQVEDLEEIALRTENLVEVRDTCVRGHRALLRAEAEQARAGRMLAELTGSDSDEDRIAPERAAEVEQALEASNRAVEEARQLLHTCQSELAALSAGDR